MEKEALHLFGVSYTHIGSLKDVYPTLYKQVKKGAKAGEAIFVKDDGKVKQFRVIREHPPNTNQDFIAPQTILTENNEVYRKLSKEISNQLYT